MLTIRSAQAWAGVKHVVTEEPWASIAGGEWERSVWTRLGAQSAGYSNLRRLAPNRTVPRMATPAKTTVDRRGRPPRNRREDKSLRGGATSLLFGVSKANANALTVRQVDYC